MYHKSTHTDQYLQWDSHHNLAARYSVIGTITHRAKTVCIRPELFQREIQYLGEALVRWKYPRWAITKVQNKYINSNWEDNNIYNNNNQQDNSTQGNNNPSSNTEGGPTREKPNVAHVVISYIQGLGDGFKKIYGKYGIQTYFKGNITIKQLLMKPKDQDPEGNKSGAIYSYQFWDIAYGEEYIGENIKDTGWKIQGTPQTALYHLCTQPTNWTQHITWQLQHYREGGPCPAQTIKEAIYYKGNQSNSQ